MNFSAEHGKGELELCIVPVAFEIEGLELGVLLVVNINPFSRFADGYMATSDLLASTVLLLRLAVITVDGEQTDARFLSCDEQRISVPRRRSSLWLHHEVHLMLTVCMVSFLQVREVHVEEVSILWR